MAGVDRPDVDELLQALLGSVPVGHVAVEEDVDGGEVGRHLRRRRLQLLEDAGLELVAQHHHGLDVIGVDRPGRPVGRLQHHLDLLVLDGALGLEVPDAAPTADDLLELHRFSFTSTGW